MPQPEPVRKRWQALDGTSFRFERKAQTLFVNDLPAQVGTQQGEKRGLVIADLATEGFHILAVTMTNAPVGPVEGKMLLCSEPILVMSGLFS